MAARPTIFAALLAAFCAGCSTSADVPCEGDQHCPRGFVCAAGLCEPEGIGGDSGPRGMLESGVIETFAGGGLGDGLPADEAILRDVQALATDGEGNVYVGDFGNAVIRHIAPDGTIETIAGLRVHGTADDAPSAGRLTEVSPTGLALHGGYLYYGDNYGTRVHRIDLESGVVELVAGDEWGAYDGDGGPATEASLAEPRGLAFDSDGNLYIADRRAHRVRMVDAATGVIDTVAGTGSAASDGDGGLATEASLDEPWGLALSGSSLYISENDGDRIRRVDLSDGTIETVAGTGEGGFAGDGGPAVEAQLSSPRHIAVDGAGDLYITDYSNHRIRRVDGDSGTIQTIAGGQDCCFITDGVDASQTYLPRPSAIALTAGGGVLIADERNHLVREVSSDGVITTYAGGGSPDGDAALGARLNSPRGLAFDGAGGVLVADRESARVLRIDLETETVSLVAGRGIHAFVGDGDQATQALLHEAAGVAVGPDGHVYIADTENDRVRKVDAETGVISTVAGGGEGGDGGPANQADLDDPRGLAFGMDGSLYIADAESHRIRRVNGEGIISTVAGDGTAATAGDGGPATAASLNWPTSLAFDDDGNLYVTEEEGHVIRKISPDGTISTLAGTGEKDYCGEGVLATLACLESPAEIAVAGPSLYLVDRGNSRIRHIDLDSGIITTPVGGGCCRGGDGDAVTAKLDDPYGVAALPDGSIVISDDDSGLIKRLKP